MTDCPICALAEKPSDEVVFSSDRMIITAPKKGLALGHLQLFPRKHATILEHLSKEELFELFSTANLLSSAVFQLFQAQGTNIIVQNGIAAGQAIAHTSVHILPRKQDDGLDLQWEMKQSPAAELEEAASAIKSQLIPLDMALQQKPEPATIDEKRPEPQAIAHGKDEKTGKEKVNYMLKQLHRVP